MEKTFFFAFILLVGGLSSFAQSNNLLTDSVASKEFTKAASNTPAKSNLSYSALSEFIQSSVTTGTNGGFNLKSTFFGLHSLFSNGNDSLSNYYLPHTAGRNTELSLGINKASTSTDQLSLVTFGLKYAPVNKRDKSYHNFATEAGLIEDFKMGAHVRAYATIIYGRRYVIDSILRATIKDPERLIAAKSSATQLTEQKLNQLSPHIWTRDDLNSILIQVDADVAVTQKADSLLHALNVLMIRNQENYVDPSGKAKVDPHYKTIADSVFKADMNDTFSSYYKDIQKKFNTQAKIIEMGDLLTFSLNPGYNVQKKHWDTTTFTIKYLKGLGSDYDKPWNLDAQLQFISLQDSTVAKQNFGHNKANLSLGFDKVFSRDDKDNPILEAEFQGECDKVLSGRFAHEATWLATANIVTSVHISKSFTLPLTIKYAPKNSNLFGFLSVQWNLQSNSTNKN